MTETPHRRPRRGRSASRELALQALYQWQLGGQRGQDVLLEFLAERMTPAADTEFFKELVMQVTERSAELDAVLGEFSDRPTAQLDPVEHGVLLIGLYELAHRVEIPWRVVINEAVDLCRRYGGSDSHRFVNALLDRAARRYRALETGAAG
ncbi:transcription antitermination factor NusB [Wenzhouxiangella sp. XN24]|uniref:transcription antitermination factor NusB n=1 Tax=Wenzhouxiangella sp. XN24 TaxID=2713569 RepID=UPI0013EAA045|nr:transcription antitermination factor NusB [Wenzhouxiangella sp. XN24]